MYSPTKFIPALFIFLFLLPLVSSSLAEDVTIEWDAPTTNTDDSALLDLSGYIVFWDTTSHAADGNYTNFEASDSSTEFTIPNLSPGNYFVAVKAFNLLNIESAFSEEFSFNVAMPPAAEIVVRGNGVSIISNDSTPSTADHTDFGSKNVSGETQQRTFTVQNTGDASLSLTGSPQVTITGSGSSDFSVTSQPASSVAASGSTTFTVTFNPSASGSRNASIIIPNNDSDENPYNFSIRGTGIEVTAPEIGIKGNNLGINDSDPTPRAEDNTDFGSVDVSGGPVTKSFVIENTGSASLSLVGSPRIQLSGANSSDFSVVSQPASTVAAGSSVTFQLRFEPSAAGQRNATVSISNNDSNENPYTFAIRGTGQQATPKVPAAPTLLRLK